MEVLMYGEDALFCSAMTGNNFGVRSQGMLFC